MPVTMKRNDFMLCNDIQLIWNCIEPTIQQIRGKNFVVKSEVYMQLNSGQRALLMFQMLYGHTTEGIEEFFAHLSYLLSNGGVWLQLKKGMQYFDAYDMMQVIDQIEKIYHNLNVMKFDENAEQKNTSFGDNNSVEISELLNGANKMLKDALPSTISLIATYIRKNSEEFVELIN